MKMKNAWIQVKKALCAIGAEDETIFRSAVITAAGSGTRMGGVSKQLMEIGGKSVLGYSLDAFCASRLTREIIISAKEEEIPLVEEVVRKGGYDKVTKIVKGGRTRQESVANAFYAIDKKSQYVAIHDAARPLIRPEDIDRLFAEARKFGAATAGQPVADTLKRCGKGDKIEADVDREGLWAVQTPQVFYCDIYRAALAMAQKDGFSVTDDNSLVTHAGFPVKLVDIGNKNGKLTTPEDVEIVSGILAARRKEK